MYNNSSFKLTCFVLVLAIAFHSCKKEDFAIPPSQAHFGNELSGNYFVTGPTVSYTIPVGVTNVTNSDRTINISVTSPTGAQLGTHYSLSTTSVVIPAGQALDSIVVQGVYNEYLNGRKDSLIFTIQEGSGAAPSQYNNTFRLFMRGPCFQGEIATELQSILGTYANTFEYYNTTPWGGPYVTTISNATLTSPTTANITVTNIYNEGWSPAVFTLNWTDPANSIVTLQTQIVGGNAGGTFGAAYNGMPMAIRAASSGAVGTFSYCNQKFTLRMNLGVSTPTGLGFDGGVYRVEMSR